MEYERLSGILVHPTSFPGKYGIGDLGKSAYKFIDFLNKGKQRLWQILPLNPTGFGDSPYQSFSTFAGNHLLISPEILLEEGMLDPQDLERFISFDEKKIDYDKVILYKMGLYKTAFDAFRLQNSRALNSAYNKFCIENQSWLDDYTLFVAIKNHFINERKNLSRKSDEFLAYTKANKKFLTDDQINDFFYGAVWTSWPADLKKRVPVALDKWRNELEEEIDYQKFLQYEFSRQWDLLKSYANGNSIQIIGDIPIFVALDSADVWANKELFLLDKNDLPTAVAGVPPDYFSETGQLWGNPLYDWNAHEKTNYSWWVKRISHTLKTVDILRIDHFRGFESYWSIPYGEKDAVSGKWKKGPGRAIFDEISRALGSLPIIAEDLGIITEEVGQLRNLLGLPGMKVLQFGFDGSRNNLNMPHNIRTSDVVYYTGTHDNDTTAGWYANASESEKDKFRRYMNVSGMEPSWDLIRLAFLSVAVFAVFPIQDVLSLGSDARMNIPGVPSGNWQFRYSDEMLTDDLAGRLRYLSDMSDRNEITEEEQKIQINK